MKQKQLSILMVLLLCLSTLFGQVRKPFQPRTSQYSPDRNTYTIKGDFTVLGNTNLILQPYTDQYGNNNNGKVGNTIRPMRYVDIDGDASTVNSSSAKLVFPDENGCNPACTEVVYAGLYWMSRADPVLYGDNIMVHNQVVDGKFTVTQALSTNYNTYTITRNSNNQVVRQIRVRRDIIQIETRNGNSGDWTTHSGINSADYKIRIGSGDENLYNDRRWWPGHDGSHNLSGFHFSLGGVTYYIYGVSRYYGLYIAKDSGMELTLNGHTMYKNKIKFKHQSESAYTTVTATTSEILYPTADTSFNGNYFINVGYAEVTDYVRAHGEGNYFGADIALSEGPDFQVGYCGGWALVVVFQNEDMKWRNITLFDGYALTNENNHPLIEVNGFEANPAGDVAVKVAMMAAEGDKGMPGDRCRMLRAGKTAITDNASTYFELHHGDNLDTNFFNGSIYPRSTSNPNRNPNYLNNCGIDISMMTLPNQNKEYIQNGQTSTQFKFSCVQTPSGVADIYVPWFFGISIQCYVPEPEAFNAFVEVEGAHFDETENAYVVRPGDSISFLIDIRNRGTESVRDAVIQVPIPRTANLATPHSFAFMAPERSGSTEFDAMAGANGTAIWHLDRIPAGYPDSVYATLRLDFVLTEDCYELMSDNEDCKLELQVDGTLTAIGELSNVPVSASTFVVGYEGGGQCKGELVRHPIRVILDRQAYLDEGHCQGDYSVRVLQLCTEPASPNTIDFMDVYTNYPSGTRFFNTYPITESTVEYTHATGFPLGQGDSLNVIAVTNAANSACYTHLRLKKSSQLENAPTVTSGETTIHYCVNETAQPLSTHVTATNGYTLYFYRTQDGAAETDIVPSTDEPGTYTYYVRQGTENCISDTVQIKVIVHSPATLSTSLTDDEACAGNSFTVTATGAPGTYTWNSEYNGFASQSNRVLTISAGAPAGTLNVTYTVTGSSEYCESGAAISKIITINPATVAGHIEPPTTQLCQNGSFSDLVLHDYVGEVVKWEYRTGTSGAWTTIYNTTDHLSADMVNTITATTYFRATVRSGNCGEQITPEVSVTPNTSVAPSAPKMPTPQYACPNTSYTINVGSNTVSRLRWYATESSGSPDASLRTVQMGTSSVTRYVSIVDNSGACESKRTVVSVLPKFNAGSIIDGKTVSCIGGTAPTIQNSYPAESYQTGVDATYSWTVTPAGGTETTISGATDASYSVPASYMSTEGSYTFRRYAQVTGCPEDPSVGEYKLTVVDCDAEYTEEMCPLKEGWYYDKFDTTFEVGTVSGDYIHHGSKVVDGVTIDTTALLHLTIWDEYEKKDTVDVCLYEETYSKAYSKDENVTITISTTGVSVTSSSASVVVETVDASTGDFILRYKTIHGCDSIVNLHVDYNVVQRKTVYKDTLYAGTPYTTVFSDKTFNVTAAGTYTIIDTISGGAANGCDSITTRILIVEPLHYDTTCQQAYNTELLKWDFRYDTTYCWEYNDVNNCIKGKTPDANGYYEFPGQRTINGEQVDTVSYLQLTVKPTAETSDNKHLCLDFNTAQTFEYNADTRISITVTPGTGVSLSTTASDVTILEKDPATGDFVLKYTAANGCDSIVNLHIGYDIVQRDTVTADTLHIPGQDYDKLLADHTFHVTNKGVMTYTDTVSGSNGCDSITVRILVIEEPHEVTICDSTFNTSHVWEDNFEPYCWEYNDVDNCISGKTPDEYGYYEFTGKKTIYGTEIDTVSYLHLTVDKSSRETDTVDVCLYYESHTETYSKDSRVTITTTTTGVEVTSSTTEIEVITVSPENGEFFLKMKTDKGCDSIIALHVNYNVVQRDTVYKDTLYAGTPYTTVFSDKTFNVTETGTYTIIDTIPGSNGCDSITTRILIVEPLHKDTICQSEFATYTWRGNSLPASTDSYGYYEFPGQKTFNGEQVDTVSYLLLTINPNPVVEVTSLSDLCPNVGFGALTATITTATVANYTFVWKGDLNTIPTTTTTPYLTNETAVAIPAPPASCGKTYYDTVTVTDANGCSAMARATVSVKTPATPTIAAKTGIHDDDLGCNPSTFVLTYENFTVTDECNGAAQAVVTPSTVVESGCGREISFTANYTNACNASASPVTITYTWTVDLTAPTILLKTGSEADGHNWGCNPTVVPPAFTVSDNCVGNIDLPADSVSEGAVIVTGTCGRSQTWTAHYTDPCKNKATNLDITYYWTVDATVPTILLKTGSEADGHNWGCNPSIVAPAFTVSDNCVGDIDLPADSVTVGEVINTSTCGRSQTWTAHYTDPCNNKAENMSITYYWTADATVPTIALKTGSEADGHDWGCNPTVIPPAFTVSDNCAGDIDLPADSVTVGTVTNTSTCGRSQTWTAHYTDPCNNKATNLDITYYWTIDATVPTILLKTGSEADGHNWGCNPSIVAPAFTVSDNCVGNIDLPADSVTVGEVINTSTCDRSQTWTAHYTDPCNNKAENVSITYYWTADVTVPTIALKTGSEADGHDWGCNPPVVVAPAFTVSDNCAGSSFDLPTDSVTVGDVINTSTCGRSRTWTAHYTDPCNNKAENVNITYTWTEDLTNPTFTVPDDKAVCRNIDNTYDISLDETGNVTDAADNCTTTPNVSYIDEEPITNADGSLTIVRRWTVTDDCDNYTVQNQTITVNPRLTFTDAVEICENELPYIFYGHQFTTAGTQSFTVPSLVTGCDSTSTLTVSIKAPLVVSTPLVCPPDLVYTLWYGRCDTVVTLTEMATMEPSVPNTTIVNDLSLHNPLTEGSHTITWSLLDECDNVIETCTQNIKVQRMPCDSARDFDGNVYPAAYIGCDCWTLVNLKSEHYSDGTPIAQYTRYSDSDSLEHIYGKLYSWYSAARVPEGDDSAVPVDSLWRYGTYVEGICPAGWALPTVEDYVDMFVASGNQAGLVKSPSTEVWLPGKQGIAPNLFNAYGAGYYEGSIDRYYNLLGETHFWAADYSANSTTSTNFVLNYYCDTGLYQESLKGLGYSIRCVKRNYVLPQ
ncbi:MAG: fibrobacter succinogenes major paralogous domain-containing protein [Bacteroidales bacterium]|nr:fibrobacter succinogenes major paralogous domain-containing protein [Bacteroidales bacterium]